MALTPQAALSLSEFLQRETSCYPELLNLSCDHPYPDGELQNKYHKSFLNIATDEDLKSLVRSIRREELVRIATRDLTQAASLNETLRDISDLADMLIQQTTNWWHNKLVKNFGKPLGKDTGREQELLVLAMGKLGGRELNFSSDIDLIYLISEDGKTSGEKSLTNQEFFTRLARQVTRVLSELTSDGFVYRVDLRLRPFGETGPLVTTFAAAEHYYLVHGRAWERYALVKARAVTGQQFAQELHAILRPFIYRRYIDFSALDSLRELKEMIRLQVRKKGRELNLKLGAGGIRELEFIVQSYQLIHGGREKELQETSFQKTLQALVSLEHLSAKTAKDIKQAYSFLRRAENHIQQWNDEQTHDLPQENSAQQALAISMGYESYSDFMADLTYYRTGVEELFDLTFAQEQKVCELTENLAISWRSGLDEQTQLLLTQLGFTSPKTILNQLNSFKKIRSISLMSATSRARLDEVLPLLLKQISLVANQEDSLQRLLDLIATIARRSVYLVLLKENPKALEQLVKLCSASSWVADHLRNYPALLDQLINPAEFYQLLNKQQLLEDCQKVLTHSGKDQEEFMLEIRHWKHSQVFKIAAADIMQELPLMKVSDYLTWIAEAVLQVSHDYIWQEMTQRFGAPAGLDKSPFMIIGYGKLGGIELGYASDLDLVMLYDSSLIKGEDTSVFFTRFAQRLSSILTLNMPSGQLYEVDSRLRPYGSSGTMVMSLAGFIDYQETQAWLWETQALIRARCLVGQEISCKEFAQIRLKILYKKRDATRVKAEFKDMRAKMRQELDQTSSKSFDLKHGRGGIVDLEFIVQYLVLQNPQSNLAVYSDNMRILDLVKQQKILPEETVKMLQNAYREYRSTYHIYSLQNQQVLVAPEDFQQERDKISQLVQKLFN